MRHAGEILGSYAVTLAGIGVFTTWMLRRARRLARLTSPDDRPWT